MLPRGGRGYAPSWCAGQEAEAYEERLSDLLDGFALLGDGNGQGLYADGSSAKTATQRVEYGTVEPVKTEIVDLIERKRIAGDGLIDDSPGPHLGEVAHAAQKSVGNARSPA